MSAQLASVLENSIRQRLRKYRRELRRARKHPSEETVHNLRVAMRRLISIARLTENFLSERRLSRVRRRLKKHLSLFSPLRDVQIQLLLSAGIRNAFPGFESFETRLKRREARLIRKIEKRLKGIRTSSIEHQLPRIARHVRATFGGVESSRSLATATAAVDDAFSLTVSRRMKIDPADTKTIHRTRIAFKKFRYMVEVLQPLLPSVTEDQIAKMQAFQIKMGDIQDMEVFIAGLTRFTKDCEPPHEAMRPLLDELSLRRAELIARFLACADELYSFWEIRKLQLKSERFLTSALA